MIACSSPNHLVGIALAALLVPGAALADGNRPAAERAATENAAASGHLHPALQHVVTGRRAYDAGDYSGAVRAFEASMPGLSTLRASGSVTDRQIARVYVGIGRCYEHLGQPAKAIDAFRSARKRVAGTPAGEALGRQIAALEARAPAVEKQAVSKSSKARRVAAHEPAVGATSPTTRSARSSQVDDMPSVPADGTGHFVGAAYVGIGTVSLTHYALDGLTLVPGLDAGVGGRLEYAVSSRFALRTDLGYRYSRFGYAHQEMDRSGFFELHSGTLALAGRLGLFGTGVFLHGGGHVNVDLSGSKTDVWRGRRRTRDSAIGTGTSLGGQGGLGYEWTLDGWALSAEVEGRYTLASPMPGAAGHTSRVGGNVGVKF